MNKLILLTSKKTSAPTPFRLVHGIVVMVAVAVELVPGRQP
jgi:hypothetical protein